MKPREMQQFYEEACRTASNRPIPDPAQAKVWQQVLGAFDVADLRGGLELWWASTDRTHDGELKSKWLPAPAELKLLCEQTRRSRAAKAAKGERLVRWECVDCKTTTCAFLMNDSNLDRRCKAPYRMVDGKRKTLSSSQICGAQMRPVFDEAKGDISPVTKVVSGLGTALKMA